MGRKHRSNCCVSSCINTSVIKPNYTFYTLPKEEERRNEWLRVIGREDLMEVQQHHLHKYYNVCQDHFTTECFIERPNRKVLVKGAVPSLCLPQIQTRKGDIFLVSSSTQTLKPQDENNYVFEFNSQVFKDQTIQNTYGEASNSSRKRKNGDVDVRTKIEKMCKKFLPNDLTQLVKAERKIIGFNGDDKYCESQINFYLNLYYGCSQAYHLLQSALRLPKVETLFENIKITTETNGPLFNVLKTKISNMKPLEKHSLIVIDTMPLTSELSYDDKEDKIIGFHEVNGIQSLAPAVKVLVLIVRGMFSEWKQPVGYAFLSEGEVNIEIANWVNEVMNKLCDIGLNLRIINFACEELSQFFERRYISVDAPYFIIGNRKVYHITDPALLLKSFHNCFRCQDFYFKKFGLAKYEHIVKFYNIDKNNHHRLAPNLTNNHICPDVFEKRKTYAVDIFSKTVAAGLSAFIDCGKIEGGGTVELVSKMSDLFESLNSTNDANENNRLFSGYISKITFLKKMSTFFCDLRVQGKGKKKYTEMCKTTEKLTRSFQITINSFIRLYEDLKLEIRNHLRMHTLNEGLTDEFFKQIRLKCKNGTKPTVKQFITAYKKIFVFNALKPLSGHNKQEDYDVFLFNTFKSIMRQTTTDISKDKLSSSSNTRLKTTDEEYITIPHSYNPIDGPDKHTLIYVSGYLLKKHEEHHVNCQIFKNYVKGIGKNYDDHSFSKYSEYSRRKAISLRAAPCDTFVEYIEKLEEKFRKVFRKYVINYKVEQSLYKEMNYYSFLPPCPCFEISYLIKLFIKTRIAYTIHLNNTEFLRNQKRFVIPLLLDI